jgi:hypothetical protein
MICTFLAALLAAVPVPEVAVPKGPPPVVVLVTVQPDGAPIIPRTVTEYVPAIEEYTVKVGDRVETRKRTVYTPQQKEFHIALEGKELQVFGTDGKKVEAGDLRKLVSGPTAALASADGKPVDPFYLKMFREGTLVLVSPDLASHLGAPAGPPPATPKAPPPPEKP